MMLSVSISVLSSKFLYFAYIVFLINKSSMDREKIELVYYVI